MLFEYNNFWKTILILLLSWSFYGIFGYKVTVVTLLAFIYSNSLKK